MLNKNEQKGQCQTKLEQQSQCQTKQNEQQGQCQNKTTTRTTRSMSNKTKWAKQQQKRYGHALNEQTVSSLY